MSRNDRHRRGEPPHPDTVEEKKAAAHLWADQLYQAGARAVDGFDFAGVVCRDGRPVGDLADFATLLDEEAPAVVRVLAGLQI